MSDAPSLGYTGAYAFANVILTLAATLSLIQYDGVVKTLR